MIAHHTTRRSPSPQGRFPLRAEYRLLKYNSEKEKKEAEEWLEKHGDMLPQMSDGYRINGDPIIYTGAKPPEYIKRTQPHWDDSQTKHEIIAAIESVLVHRGFTNLQLFVMKSRCEGFNQSSIAKMLGVTRQAINDIQNNAKQRLTA